MVCYGQNEMASQYFALGIQFPPAPQSPFSLYSMVNKLHSPDRTAFAFWAHMLLHLGNVAISYYAAHIVQYSVYIHIHKLALYIGVEV